jgi:dTDP-glucose 4,6-dehydratase
MKKTVLITEAAGFIGSHMGGANNKIVFKAPPENDPVKRKPDIAKAIKILNWQSLVSRKKGLENAFNYFKSLTLEELNKKDSRFA